MRLISIFGGETYGTSATLLLYTSHRYLWDFSFDTIKCVKVANRIW